MDPIQLGEIIEMEDGKEYITFSDLVENNCRYLFMVCTTETIEAKIVRERIEGSKLMLDYVDDPVLKAHLLPKFQDQIREAMENGFELDPVEDEEDFF